MVNYETFITIRNKITPFAYCFVAIFALLFVQFLYYSAQTPIAYVIGIVVTYQILRYGMKRNKKVIQCVPKSQQWGAFLLGCSIIASGIVISAFWTGINPILNAYRYIPLPHMFYVIFLAPIGEEVIYRQMFGLAFSGQEMTEEELELKATELMVDIVSDNLDGYEVTTKEVQGKIELAEKEGEWVITDIDEEIMNALTFGLIEGLDDFDPF